MIDFVIPCHPKDFQSLRLCINGLKNITCVNRVFVISKDDPLIEGVCHISESLYDEYVTKEKINNIWLEKNPILSYRTKWIYQQFLKLLSVKIIKDLTHSFVVVDSDTIFLRDVQFNSKLFYYCRAEEYHKPYLEPIKKLFSIENTIGFSAICHHMIFNKEKLTTMIEDIENRFVGEFASIVLGILDYREGSCFSEWDTYANYMILNFPEMCQQRQLKWHDISFVPDESHLEYFKEHFDFVSCHAYKRGIE
jgi:hypothetical protein